MTIRRFAFPALLTVMMIAFAAPSYANVISSASGTITCTDYSLSISYIELTRGTTYVTDYSFTVNSGSGSSVITGTQTFVASAASQTVPVPSTSLGPISGTISVTSATATLTNSNQTESISFSYSPSPLVCTPATGRFTGGGKEIDLGSFAITEGLELDCDLNHPNNLEINWPGHHFHLEHVESMTCLLIGNPRPPVAPINYMNGFGSGRLDGVAGYDIDFTLIDNGEPGKKDMIGFHIAVSGSGATVLDLPGTILTHGNLQAHYDQH